MEELEPFPESRELAMALSNRSQLAMLAQRDDEALRWGRRAIEAARRLGDTETLVHAQTNVGSALTRNDLDAGLDLLDEAATLAIEAGLDEHAGRAMLNAAWLQKEARRYERARELLESGLAFAREREINIYVEYLVAMRAVIDLATGDWDAALAAASELIAQPRLANAVARIPALEVAGLVGVRRGQAGAREHLDEAWELARATGELQRLRPIACARAEVAWLEDDTGARRYRHARHARARARGRRRVGRGRAHAVAVPRRAARRRARAVPAPDRLRARRRCARRRAALGRIGRAVLRGARPAGVERPRAAARRHRAARPARCDPRGLPRACPAAPRRRDLRPARAASHDAR